MNEIVIGIDIGGTNTVFAAVDEKGSCSEKVGIKTNGFETLDDFISALASSVKTFLNSKADLHLSGIGIGAPNGNFFTGTVENAPNLKWKGILPVADLVNRHFEVPVSLTNDANAAALGEKIYGGAKGMKDFILITLGTGLGSGFVVNGELLYGHDGFAGELGHTIAVENGRLCGCGRKGCLETYVSAPGLCRTFNEILHHTQIPTVLRGLSEEELNAKLIFEAAERGDIAALKAFDFTSRLLGRKLADVVAITSPEAIFLFGGLAQAGGLIIDATKMYVEQYLLNIFRNKVKILPSLLPENSAAILGAAALILNTKGK